MLILSFLVISCVSFANTILVKGQIKYANGVPAAGRSVNIIVETSAVPGCPVYHTKLTDINGRYNDTVSCNSNIPYVTVTTSQCGGGIITLQGAVNNLLAEVNFNLTCNPPAINNIIVKGTIKYANGSPAINKAVTIIVDTLNASGCKQVRTTNTSGTGYYIDTFTCGLPIPNVMVLTTDCNNSPLLPHSHAVSSSTNIVESNFSLPCNAPPVSCQAYFNADQDSLNKRLFYFNSNQSSAGVNDFIVERKWTWGDGTSTTGNSIATSHNYQADGLYTVCLKTITSFGCISEYCFPVEAKVFCVARYNYNITSLSARFFSNTAEAQVGDSIISRKWNFGDSTIIIGNVVSPVHQYQFPGSYNVCLTIKTANGCEETICRLIALSIAANDCVAWFEYHKTGNANVEFNSSMCWTKDSQGNMDSAIVERKWSWGDGTLLTGNMVNPSKHFNLPGAHYVCLDIRSALGCLQTICRTVNVQDTVIVNQNGPNIEIVTVYPNPTTNFLSTIIGSVQNNIMAEYAVYDIYGTKQWSGSKLLLQGNNITTIPVNYLLTGTYVFKVSTSIGTRSKTFFKL